MADKMETGSTTSSQARVNESIAATARANTTEDDAQEVLDRLEARQAAVTSRRQPHAGVSGASMAAARASRPEEDGSQDLIDMLEARNKMKSVARLKSIHFSHCFGLISIIVV